MNVLLAEYWPLILGGLLVFIALIVVLTRRRQRVEIGNVDPVIAATLARTRPPEPVVVPTIAPEPIPLVVPPAGDADDLRRIKGLGPKVAIQLNELGITRFGQLAALDAEQQRSLDARLGTFAGRMARDRWVEQARLLEANDIAAFEAQFGKLG